MEFRPLRAFVEVARLGGFSAAAKAVFSTQSTMSKAVKQLEEELGIPLLNRTGHRPVLTAAGEVVYRRGIKLLADREDLIAELDDIRGMKRGVLRLGLASVGSGTVFAQLFALYRQRYPGIEIQLVEQGSAQLETSLRAGAIDLAGALLPSSSDFDAEVVRREAVVAILPERHPLSTRSSLSFADLKDTPFILFDSDFAMHKMVIEACRRSAFEPTIAACSSQADFMVDLVGAGLGAAFLPLMVAQRTEHSAVRSIPLNEPNCEWVMAMIWRRDAHLMPAARAWLDLVRDCRAGASDPDASSGAQG
ncbi:LysR family transcriptional regulator [Sphingomonas sp.]|uniref:LysR family transcriptional regulator n=1 Tax=Sphingomonas sp. TaxID=28214 RepID=UPI000DB11A05|nr:LysR family transcriptional regulator [Sphingomonas sp.]PZU07745.1 MAG: LysR family transcriptional regulator [Sphingomonas sp.]